MTLEIALAMLPGLVVGLTVHEFAHAWSASLLGDDFARRQGRVSLNPLRHLAPLGTLAIFLLPFGWGKPVPVNLYNFRRPRRDYLLTSLAGPAANVVIVGICLGLMQLTRHTFWFEGPYRPWVQGAHLTLALIIIVNVMLATLNLLPIPPLDGSKIWTCLVPRLKPAEQRGATWLGVVLLIVLLQTDSLNPLLEGMMRSAMQVMPQSDQEVLLQRRHSAFQAIEAQEWSKAEDAFDQVLAVLPDDASSWYGRAAARAYQGRWRECLEDLSAAIEIDPQPAYFEYRAAAHRALGQPEAADRDEAAAKSLRATQGSINKT